MTDEQEPLLDPAFLKKLERLALVAKRAFAGQMKGEKRSTKRGSSVEFADYREYMPGDDLRYVDWNTAARLDRLFIKLFVEEEDLYLALLIDSSKSMEFGSPTKLKFAAQIAAALGYIGLNNYDRVSVSAFANGLKQPLPTQRGRSGASSLFRYLNGLQPDGSTSFTKALKTFAIQAKHKGVAVVISDFLNPDWADGVKSLLSRGFQVELVHVLDEEEVNPTLVGDLRIIDSETGETKEMSVNPALLARYRARVEAFCGEIESFAHRYGLDYFRTTSSADFEEMILSRMRRGGVVK